MVPLVILLLGLIAGISAWVFLSGLVTGEGWLRVPGLAALVLSTAAIFVVDRLRERARRRRAERLPRVERDWQWPRRAA